MRELLEEKYGHFFEEKLIEEINFHGIFKKVPKDFPMINIGDTLTHIPLVIEGAIKVMGDDGNDNEYLLYYLETGDSCSMSMTCCIGNRKSQIKALAELDTKIIMIPVQKMEEWLVKYRTWRTFVFDSYDIRLKEMLSAIDALVFHNTEERIYQYLRDKAMVLHTPELSITHYQIANDLNTSRVVVSRLMKKLSLDGKIETNRNQVKVLDFTK